MYIYVLSCSIVCQDWTDRLPASQVGDAVQFVMAERAVAAHFQQPFGCDPFNHTLEHLSVRKVTELGWPVSLIKQIEIPPVKPFRILLPDPLQFLTDKQGRVMHIRLAAAPNQQRCGCRQIIRETFLIHIQSDASGVK